MQSLNLSGTEGGRTRITYFAEEGVFFKTHVHDLYKKCTTCILYPRMNYGGCKDPHIISAALMPSDFRSDRASESAAATPGRYCCH